MSGNEHGGGTIGKSLEVLDLVARLGRPVRFSDISAQSRFPKATVYRLVKTLVDQRMLIYDARSQTYRLGIRLVRLAHAAWAQSSLAPVARPHMDALSERLEHTLHLAQLDAGQVLYVDKRQQVRQVAMFSSAGKVGPAYCTGVGKVMLAHLNPGELDGALQLQTYHRHTDNTLTSEAALREDLGRIRRRGFALDDEEHEPGIICAAVPILSAGGTMMGALSATDFTTRSSIDALVGVVPMLKETAHEIAAAFGQWDFPAGANALQPTGT